jgi:CBS-domain-containing membrane protein
VSSANLQECAAVDISDEDVVAAMRAMRGYIDITPADFRQIYQVAYALAKERMLNALKAADIMRRPVHAIAAGADLIAAATLLAEKGVSGAPVIDGDGRIVGVLSEKDFLRKNGRRPKRLVHAGHRPVPEEQGVPGHGHDQPHDC